MITLTFKAKACLTFLHVIIFATAISHNMSQRQKIFQLYSTAEHMDHYSSIIQQNLADYGLMLGNMAFNNADTLQHASSLPIIFGSEQPVIPEEYIMHAWYANYPLPEVFSDCNTGVNYAQGENFRHYCSHYRESRYLPEIFV